MKFGNPIAGRLGALGKPDPDSGWAVTRGFADNSMPQYGPHDGLDVGNGASGGAVLAMADGTVYQAFFDSASGGAGIVRIDHGDGWTTGYAHMDTIAVRAGQAVRMGAEIGRHDTTGWATGAHLHYDISEGAYRRDPWPYANQLLGSSEGFWMHTYGGADFDATDKRYKTLAGARFRSDTSTSAGIIEEFSAGVAVSPHAIVKGGSVNGDDRWYLAWMYADNKYRMGAFHRSTLAPA
jgi:murein DD-endopeptidase MepM/ murein hydrolase activator NlpD